MSLGAGPAFEPVAGDRPGGARPVRLPIDLGWTILALGVAVYVLGVVLSVLYAPDSGVGFR